MSVSKGMRRAQGAQRRGEVMRAKAKGCVKNQTNYNVKNEKEEVKYELLLGRKRERLSLRVDTASSMRGIGPEGERIL